MRPLRSHFYAGLSEEFLDEIDLWWLDGLFVQADLIWNGCFERNRDWGRLRFDRTGRSGWLAWHRNRSRLARLTVPGTRPVAALRLRRARLGWGVLRLQDSGPVELNVRIVLLDESNRVLVERRPSDADSGWGPKPIKDSRTRLAAPTAAAMGVDDKRVLVAAFIAAEPEVRQDYFLFCARDALFRAGGLPRADDAFRAGGFARRAAAERAAEEAGRADF